MKVSEHFDRTEFACHCGCGQDTIDAELLRALVMARQHYNIPIKINSANRCLEYNRSIGSKDTSQHIKSKAADIVIKGVSPIDVYNYFDSIFPDSHGIGVYDTFTHIDSRDEKARWSKRT